MAFRNLLAPTLYLRIAPDSVLIRSSNSDAVWSDEAVLALRAGPSTSVLAAGAAARLAVAQTPGAILCKPFGHPRCLISDYTAAEAFLKHALLSYLKLRRVNRWLMPSPHMLLHPCSSPAQAVGDLTGVEHRALRELGQRCGARNVELMASAALSEEQIQTLMQRGPVRG